MKRRMICLVLMLALTLTGCVHPGALTIETEYSPKETEEQQETAESVAPATAPTENAETQPPETQPAEPVDTQPTESAETQPMQPEEPKLTARQAFVYDCGKEEYLEMKTMRFTPPAPPSCLRPGLRCSIWHRIRF